MLHTYLTTSWGLRYPIIGVPMATELIQAGLSEQLDTPLQLCGDTASHPGPGAGAPAPVSSAREI